MQYRNVSGDDQSISILNLNNFNGQVCTPLSIEQNIFGGLDFAYAIIMCGDIFLYVLCAIIVVWQWIISTVNNKKKS